MKITKETYPLAVAVLPGVFATIPFSKVKRWGTKAFLSNSWMSKDVFEAKYRFVGKRLFYGFTSIEQR